MSVCAHEIDMNTARLSMRKGGWIGKCNFCGERIILRHTIATGDRPYVNTAKKGGRA